MAAFHVWIVLRYRASATLSWRSQ